jgi:hypothetical protein
MPFLDFEAIKRDAPLQRVLDYIGWVPTWSRGDQARGPCPIHRSQTLRSRSFAIQGEGWFCHSCKENGDVIRLWAILFSKTPYEAARDMCQTLGTPLYCLRAVPPSHKQRNGEEAR